jgi:hypothetical protein
MRRESHRRRGIRRARAGGWGHRAVYAGAIVATASLLAGFGVAGFYFGTFSHVFPQSSASGSAPPPYGVYYLSEGALFAADLPNANFSNASGAGPCQNLTANGTNTLNNTSASNPINLSASNATNSRNLTNTFVCLNAVFGGNITYQWNFVNGTFGNFTNQTAWDNVSAPVNNTSANNMSGGWYNVSLANFTGNANLTNSSINESGCLPVFTNVSQLTNCRWFAGNSNTTYMPHGGFYASNGTWISLANNSSPDPWYWHPNQTGYLPGDELYQATIAFANYTPANTTYQVAVFFEGVTPVPQIYYVNTGAGGQNETVTFVFDMTLAWTTGLAGNLYGSTNNTTTNGGMFSSIIADVLSVSLIVSQCYVDASGSTVCPLATAPIYGSILA